MNMKLVEQVTAHQLKTDLPVFKAGDTINVTFITREGNKERTQVYSGLVLKRQGSGIAETFTVRKLNGESASERTFPIHSPLVNKIEVLKKGRVRRAKLYYMRNLFGKNARVKEIISFKKKGNSSEK